MKDVEKDVEKDVPTSTRREAEPISKQLRPKGRLKPA